MHNCVIWMVTSICEISVCFFSGNNFFHIFSMKKKKKISALLNETKVLQQLYWPDTRFGIFVQLQKLSVPQKLFIHFYVLAFVWTTLLLAATWIYAYSTTPKISEPLLFSSIASHLTGGSRIFSLQRSHTSKEHRSRIAVSIFLLLLMEAQVLRRLFESIYVFKYSPSARMHILGYLTGLL